MKPILALLAAVFALCATSHGQEPALLKTNLLTYAPAGMPAGFAAFYQTSSQIHPFNASAGSLGTPVLYNGSQRFAIRSSAEEFALPAKQLAEIPPLATVNLPPNADTVLILCVPESAGKVRLIAYDVSSSTLRRGSYRVFNFSTKSLSVIMDKQRFTVSPKSDQAVDDPGWHDKTIAMPLQIATVTDKKAKLVYSNFWEHYPQRRSLLFLFDGRHVSDPVIFSSFDVDTPAAASVATTQSPAR